MTNVSQIKHRYAWHMKHSRDSVASSSAPVKRERQTHIVADALMARQNEIYLHTITNITERSTVWTSKVTAARAHRNIAPRQAWANNQIISKEDAIGEPRSKRQQVRLRIASTWDSWTCEGHHTTPPVVVKTKRPLRGWMGREGCARYLAKRSRSLTDTASGFLSTSQVTPSVHGAEVKEPSYW